MERSEQEKIENCEHGQLLQDSRSIGLIINSIVHSFNNVIGVIRGYADLSLRATALDSRIYPYLKNIIDGADSMKELSEKMRIFSEQAKQDLKLVRIHPIIEEAVNVFTTSSSSVKIQRDIDTTCSAVLADAGQIRQMVINLCGNAYDALRDTGGVIEVILKEIDVDASFAQAQRGLNEGRHLKLTVMDTGMGIDQEILGKIFEPFFTARKTEESAGLGLTVVQGIVKNHKGEIIVESKLGEGTRVDIYLPLAKDNYEEEKG